MTYQQEVPAEAQDPLERLHVWAAWCLMCLLQLFHIGVKITLIGFVKYCKPHTKNVYLK